MAARIITTLSFILSLSLFAEIGSPCLDNSYCEFSEQCIMEFEAGYCVKFDCISSGECGEKALCVSVKPDNFNLCLSSCSDKLDCREGYKCTKQKVCLPD